MVATSINVLKNIDTIIPDAEDIKEIRKLKDKKDLLEILSRSIAPSIFGYEFIKKSISL